MQTTIAKRAKIAKKLLPALATGIMLCILAACASGPGPITTVREITDRAGNTTQAPQTPRRIISLGPGNTEILVDLGMGEYLVAVDTFSVDVPYVPASVALLDMMAMDVEVLLSQNADVIFVAGIMPPWPEGIAEIFYAGGVAVLYIPTSESLRGIMDDILFIGDAVGQSARAADIVGWMQDELHQVSSIAANIQNPARVYFEISPAPTMFSFGRDVFLDEMLAAAGAVNVLADFEGWVMISDEEIFAANPDVIITNNMWLPDPIGDITSRPWGGIAAIDSRRVYRVDANATSRPSHNVIHGLWEIARVLHPEYFGAR